MLLVVLVVVIVRRRAWQADVADDAFEDAVCDDDDADEKNILK